MKKIDLQKIIESNGLDPKVLASELFPKNKYPIPALTRILEGKAELDSSQISKLASLLGSNIDELYNSGWKAKGKNNILHFSRDNFRAEFDLNSWSTRIFEDDSLFHESIIHQKSISISDYISDLDELITKHKNQG